MIIYFILGLLVTNSLLILWFFSPLYTTLSKIFLGKEDIYTFDQFIDFIAIKSYTLSTLLSCWICMSFWLSLIVGSFFMLSFNLPLWYPLLTYFTYPSILFLVKQIYR
jgi:hypothetical protein